MNHYSVLESRDHQSSSVVPSSHGQPESHGGEARPMSSDQRLTLTIPEACQALGIGETMLRQMIRVEQLPILRIGRRVLIPRQAVESLVAGACGDTAALGNRTLAGARRR